MVTKLIPTKIKRKIKG